MINDKMINDIMNYIMTETYFFMIEDYDVVMKKINVILVDPKKGPILSVFIEQKSSYLVMLFLFVILKGETALLIQGFLNYSQLLVQQEYLCNKSTNRTEIDNFSLCFISYQDEFYTNSLLLPITRQLKSYLKDNYQVPLYIQDEYDNFISDNK